MRTKTTDTAALISHVVGLDGPGHGPAVVIEPSSDEPVAEPHPSHGWDTIAHGGRWLECGACGMRDYYPGAERPCPATPAAAGKRPRVDEPPRTLEDAIAHLRRDLAAFGEWWLARADSLGLIRPTMAEWAAEFLEWRRAPRP